MSFGSFTCTVEGFDEPFSIMRLVVDYFQSLTRADPGFGAAPRRIDPDEVARRATMAPGIASVAVSLDPESAGEAITIRNRTAAIAPAEAAPMMAAPVMVAAPAMAPAPVAPPAPAMETVPGMAAAPVAAPVMEAVPVVAATPAPAPVLAPAFERPAAALDGAVMAPAPAPAPEAPAESAIAEILAAETRGAEPETAPEAEALDLDAALFDAAAEAGTEAGDTADEAPAAWTLEEEEVAAPVAEAEAAPTLALGTQAAPAAPGEDYALAFDEALADDDFDAEASWNRGFVAEPAAPVEAPAARPAAASAEREEEALRRVLQAIGRKSDEAQAATFARPRPEPAQAAAPAPATAPATEAAAPERPVLPGFAAGINRRITVRKRPPLQLTPDLPQIDEGAGIGRPWETVGSLAPTPAAPAERAPAAEAPKFRLPFAERIFGARRPVAPQAEPAGEHMAEDHAAPRPAAAERTAAQAPAPTASRTEIDDFVFDEEAFLARTRAEVDGTAPATAPSAAPPAEPEAPEADEEPVAEEAQAPRAPAHLHVVPMRGAAEDAPGAVNSDLRNFTRKFGAASLPDLLEASAAYATLVRGQARFSRRDIMLALDEIGQEKDYTQEARIKSFGKLLRKGSIVRVDDGKFALSRAARFSYESKLGATGTEG